MTEMAQPVQNAPVQLLGRIFIRGNIRAVTGLHIGGAGGNLEIGGVDSPVIRNPLDNRPYIPGSSIRGKMRSLAERLYGKEQNFFINRARGREVKIHTCQAGKAPNDNVAYTNWRSDYHQKFKACEICSIFGVTGDEPAPHPTSLIVRDAHLSAESVKRLNEINTDLPYTEIKWEATIDRVTSAATPRQIERVPADSLFTGFELVYNIYNSAGANRFTHALTALMLVEEDYLGGLGSRGGGKVRFELTEVAARKGTDYELITMPLAGEASTKYNLTDNSASIIEWVHAHFTNV